MGLETVAEQHSIPPKIVMFAISFKLLASEYLLNIQAVAIPNSVHALPTGFWGIKRSDVNNFESFCEKVSAKMISQIKPDIDSKNKICLN